MILYRKNPNPATPTNISRVQKLFKPSDFWFAESPNIIIEQGNCTDNLFQVCKRFRNTESPPRAPTSSLNLMTRPTLHDIVSLVSPQIWGVGGARDGL